MSVCGQTEEESSEEPPAGGGAPVREMYEQKAVSKVVRVLTVLAYLLSVSLAAILLSVYYVCVWQSPKLPPLNDTDADADAHYDALAAHQAHHHHYYHNHTQHYHNQTRGSNTSMSDVLASTPEELSSLPEESTEPPDPSPYPSDTSTPIEDSNLTWALTNDTTHDQR